MQNQIKIIEKIANEKGDKKFLPRDIGAVQIAPGDVRGQGISGGPLGRQETKEFPEILRGGDITQFFRTEEQLVEAVNNETVRVLEYAGKEVLPELSAEEGPFYGPREDDVPDPRGAVGELRGQLKEQRERADAADARFAALEARNSPR